MNKTLVITNEIPKILKANAPKTIPVLKYNLYPADRKNRSVSKGFQFDRLVGARLTVTRLSCVYYYTVLTRISVWNVVLT